MDTTTTAGPSAYLVYQALNASQFDRFKAAILKYYPAFSDKASPVQIAKNAVSVRILALFYKPLPDDIADTVRDVIAEVLVATPEPEPEDSFDWMRPQAARGRR